jgi:predicted secreted Zn-dependent protease
MPRSRISIAFYLVLVFASGILVGVVSHRLYATNTASASTAAPANISEFRKRYLDGMRTRVGASDEQVRQITQTLDETERKFDALAAQEKPLHDKIQQDHVDHIKALLNDKQRQAYDDWRAERARIKAQQATAQKK